MKKRKVIWLFFICICIVLGIWGLVSLRQSRHGETPEEKSLWTDDALKGENYEAVFAAMDGDFYFSQQEFLDYRGLQVVKAQKRLESFADIRQMTELVNKENAGVNTIYLQLNPMQLYENIEDGGNWQEALQTCLVKQVKSTPKITYEILLSYPSMEYFAGLSDEEWERYKQVNLELVEALAAMENVFIYYLGDQEWLNANLSNYESAFLVNRQVEKNIVLSTFCDRKYVVTPDELQVMLDDLEMQILDYRVYKYPDYSEWSFVFLGDSIIGNDRSTCSVPGVVKALTGADTYNCGKNGATAAYDEETEFSFLKVTEALITGDVSRLADEELAEAVQSFGTEFDTENLCFVINYGLNDYFLGYPTQDVQNPWNEGTYAGALRTGICQLKQAYPEAMIIVMLPTYTVLYEEGTLCMSDVGAPLSDYRKVGKAIAEEMHVLCKDNFADISMDATTQMNFLSDGTHLNEWGKFVLGGQIIAYFERKVLYPVLK